MFTNSVFWNERPAENVRGDWEAALIWGFAISTVNLSWTMDCQISLIRPWKESVSFDSRLCFHPRRQSSWFQSMVEQSRWIVLWWLSCPVPRPIRPARDTCDPSQPYQTIFPLCTAPLPATDKWFWRKYATAKFSIRAPPVNCLKGWRKQSVDYGGNAFAMPKPSKEK